MLKEQKRKTSMKQTELTQRKETVIQEAENAGDSVSEVQSKTSENTSYIHQTYYEKEKNTEIKI